MSESARKGPRLTPKQRKTAVTQFPLHQCSNIPSNEEIKVETRKVIKKQQSQKWNLDHIDLLSFIEKDPTVDHVKKVVCPKVEHLRMTLVMKLNKLFTNNVLKETGLPVPVMTFERWLCRAKLKELQDRNSQAKNTKNKYWEPVLPTKGEKDQVLIDDLVRGSIGYEDAERLAVMLATESKKMANEISKFASKTAKEKVTAITVVKHKHSIDVCLGKKLLKINHNHYDKLKILFNRHGIGQNSAQKINKETKINKTNDDEQKASNESKHEADAEKKEMEEQEDLADFHQALFSLLARYHGIQGHGYQAACGEEVFSTLQQQFGVSMECFASPLNSYFSRFCSAFIDTDWCFGAVENFFQFFPTRGSFECNPPFVPAVMLAAVDHIHLLLERSSKQKKKKKEDYLIFVVVVPGWVDDPAWIKLQESPWKRAEYAISREDHGFCDGAQHQRMDRYRESPFDTFIFVLQNEQGASTYPATEQTELAIRTSMANAAPSDAMKFRRLCKGRGFADADGGGGIYRGAAKKRKKQAPHDLHPAKKPKWEQ